MSIVVQYIGHSSILSLSSMSLSNYHSCLQSYPSPSPCQTAHQSRHEIPYHLSTHHPTNQTSPHFFLLGQFNLVLLDEYGRDVGWGLDVSGGWGKVGEGLWARRGAERCGGGKRRGPIEGERGVQSIISLMTGSISKSLRSGNPIKPLFDDIWC